VGLQFLEDVVWGERDVLLIDTPPGTSDEQISTIEHLRAAGCALAGAVVVTTPQEVAVADVRKEISFCHKMQVRARRAPRAAPSPRGAEGGGGTLQVPVLGVVENMAGFVCPCCEEVTDIFSRGGGEALAAARGAPFLGRLPLDPRVASCMDAGVPLATVCTDAEPRAGRRASAAAS